MKKLVVLNEQGKKLFCKYEVNPIGIMVVIFYLPKDKFSVIWLKEPTMHLAFVRENEDARGRKYSIAWYHVHPTEWLGKSFRDFAVNPKETINKIAKTIKLL